MAEVYIAGTGMIPFGKDPRPIHELLYDACNRALERSKGFVKSKQPDFLVIGAMDPIGYSGQGSLPAELMSSLGFDHKTEACQVSLGSATGAQAVLTGRRLAESGKTVLVCFGEAAGYEHEGKHPDMTLASVIPQSERELGLAKMIYVAALGTDAYLRHYGISEKEFREIAFQMTLNSRRFGALNEFAYFKKEVTKAEYDDCVKNKIQASPLTTLDCSASQYSGAGAVLLVPNQTDIKLTSVKTASVTPSYLKRPNLITLDSIVYAGRNAFIDANLNPHEIDICALHDAFKSVPFVFAENSGLATRGKGAEFVLNGKNYQGKEVGINLCGGLLARTHPVGASGGAQLVELVRQLRREAQYSKMPQLDKADYALWFSMNGFGTNSIVGIVEKTNPGKKRLGLSEANLASPFVPQTAKGRIRDRIYGRLTNINRVDAMTYIPNNGDETYMFIVDTNEGKRLGISNSPLEEGKIRFVDDRTLDDFSGIELLRNAFLVIGRKFPWLRRNT